MTLALTDAAERESERSSLEPQLVLEIDGYDTLFGAVPILKYIRYGDPGIEYGDPGLVFGGLNSVEDQLSVISFDSGTTTSINQQLRPDQGNISSISSLAIGLVDKNEAISRLISPGVELTDILGRKAIAYFGFRNTAWPEDYIILFRGIIDDIDAGAGLITLNIAHPDNKKRQDIFPKVSTNLSSAINNSVTTIPLNSVTNLLQRQLSPDGVTYDPSILFYIRVDDEIIQYTGISSLNLTGCTRGALGTTAVLHDDDAEVSSFYVLEGDCMSLAQKIMLSGWNGPFVEDVEVSNFNVIGSGVPLADSIYFEGVDIAKYYGVTEGDYFTTTGASNGANNVSARVITAIDVDSTGSYLVSTGAGFIAEGSSAAVISFRSKYDTLGHGLGMSPDEVDVENHERLNDLFLGTSLYRFYLKDTINAKEFIEKEIYAPYGCYSLPRKGKSSVGLTIGPVPSEEIKILDRDNIKNPSKIKLKRTINRNFYNSIVYAFDEDTLEDQFLAGLIQRNEDSIARIPVGNRVRTFKSKGLRTDQDAVATATRAAERMLDRYKYGAEYIENLEVFYGTAFNSEPGDLVIIDFEGLQVTNTAAGDRRKPSKFYEIINKSLNIKTGAIVLSVIDTNFGARERYGLISPSTTIASGSTTTQLMIQDSYGAVFPGNEKKKWANYIGEEIIVHDLAFTDVQTTELQGFDPSNAYRMIVSPALSSPPPAGYVIDIPYYPTATDPSVNRIYKLFHAHFSPRVDVVTGVSDTSFTVAVGDAPRFFAGGFVLVHAPDFSTNSGEIEILSVVGTTVTLRESMGFTPSVGDEVDFIGFADMDSAYRLI